MKLSRLSLSRYVAKDAQSIFTSLCAICEIAAPTFHESKRIGYLAKELRKLGLADVMIDGTGNVSAKLRNNPKDSHFVVLSAHADTACHSPTPIKVQERKGHLFAHGIADNCAGITAILTFLRFLRSSKAQLSKNYLIAFTVREEGLGAKGGMREIMRRYAKKTRYVINSESHNLGRMTLACIGQLRGKITVNTFQKSAHSWRDFGEPNAVVALAKIVSDFSATRIPNNASFNVTGLSSHNGINVIPSRAECLVEIRSTDQEILDVLGKTLQRTIGKHCNKTTKASFELLASTQAASYPSDSLLARKTAEAIRSIGLEPGFETGNTDGDVPLALGIPTVTVGASNAFATHSLKEHLEKRSLLKGIEQLIAVIFALDAIEEL